MAGERLRNAPQDIQSAEFATTQNNPALTRMKSEDSQRLKPGWFSRTVEQKELPVMNTVKSRILNSSRLAISLTAIACALGPWSTARATTPPFIDLALDNGNCQKAAELFAKGMDKGRYDSDEISSSQRRIADCAVRQGLWQAIGLLELNFDNMGAARSAGDMVVAVATLAHSEVEPELVIERLGERWDYAVSIHRTEALVQHDVTWLREGAAACLEQLDLNAIGSISKGVMPLLQCVGSVTPPDAVAATEAELMAAAEQRRREEAEAREAERARIEAKRQQIIDTEVESGTCIDQHLRAMQSQVEFLSTQHDWGILIDHDIFVLNGSSTRSITAGLPGTYRVWAVSVNPVVVQASNSKGQSQPTDQSALSIIQGGYLRGVKLIAKTGETSTVSIEGRGCTVVTVIVQ